MQKFTTKRMSVIGVGIATVGVLAAGGIAAAAPLSYSQQEHLSTESTTSSYHSDSTMQGNYRDNMSDSSYTNNVMKNSWNNWNPANYQTNHTSFKSWWNGMMNQANHYTSANWSSSSTNTSWTPSGHNWQKQWANWNPVVWENNGASYSDWHTAFMNYMNSHENMFRVEFYAHM